MTVERNHAIILALLYNKPSQANPCALIGSFSVRILQYGPFPWKRCNPCIFALERSRQIQNLQPKQRKKCEYCHSSRWNFQKKLKRFFPKFQRWMKKTNIFKCKLPAVHFTIRDRVPYNKLLTNLAFSSRTGEYWTSVVFVRTSLRSVRTVTTSGQYSPVRPSRSVSKRLLLYGSVSRAKRLSRRFCRLLWWRGHFGFWDLWGQSILLWRGWRVWCCN